MNGQGPELAINPGLVIQRQPIAGGQDCLVIDDFLADPDAAVAWAAQHTQDFVAPERSYPGRLLPIDEAAARPLHEFVRSRLSREFGFLRGDLDLYTQYSIATLQPADFSWIQALPHSDPQTAPGRANYAALLYLFHDPALGGTGFTIQFGSFADRANAIKLASEIKKTYPAVRIDSELVNYREVFRVRYGQYATREEAQSAGETMARELDERYTVMPVTRAADE